jgi:hypothetical protein
MLGNQTTGFSYKGTILCFPGRKISQVSYIIVSKPWILRNVTAKDFYYWNGTIHPLFEGYVGLLTDCAITTERLCRRRRPI